MAHTTVLRRTSLYEEHLALGAKMVAFGGWEMPVHYQGIIEEYWRTRRGAAVFDICHMGEFVLNGDAVDSGLDRIVTQDLRTLAVNSCRYGMMLNERGGVKDDLIVFRLDNEKWFIVVNAATTQKDAQHIRDHLTGRARLEDISADTGKVDVQGPLSREILSAFIPGIERLDYFTFGMFDVLGEHVLVSRTGYTGELGYEIYYPWQGVNRVWRELLSRQVTPAGLGARDILRIEMGYSLYGHEIDEHISPLEAGLSRFIDWEKDFIGREVLMELKAKGVARKIVAVISDSKRAPRVGHGIFSPDGKRIGDVTSGTYSPFCERGVGLGFVAKDFSGPGAVVAFGDERLKITGQVVSRPIYREGSLKN